MPGVRRGVALPSDRETRLPPEGSGGEMQIWGSESGVSAHCVLCEGSLTTDIPDSAERMVKRIRLRRQS